ncbi:hypothetical protein BDQ17DRAFT_1429662 [Cyathus striatus]|nr:hypothetical protein BDQ17DRAFT_1429662 [Cyathus striatus]
MEARRCMGPFNVGDFQLTYDPKDQSQQSTRKVVYAATTQQQDNNNHTENQPDESSVRARCPTPWTMDELTSERITEDTILPANAGLVKGRTKISCTRWISSAERTGSRHKATAAPSYYVLPVAANAYKENEDGLYPVASFSSKHTVLGPMSNADISCYRSRFSPTTGKGKTAEESKLLL